jgi:dolichol kinase
VLLLILVFPYRLDIAAAAWGILAFGDGMATIVGTRLGGPRIPWNREKTITGAAALFVFGGLAGAARLVVPSDRHAACLHVVSIGAPFAAALVAACVETIPVRLNDNLSVPAAAGAVLGASRSSAKIWCGRLWPPLLL